MIDMHTKLYKIDTKGKTRVWWMEIEGQRYRTCAGLLDGKIVESAWTEATPKNVGRANETTAAEQAVLEVEAEYKYQEYQGGYSRDINNMGSSYFEPMLAQKYEAFVKKPVWPVYAQPKLDGVRCIAKKDGLFSREGKPFVSVPHIHRILQKFWDINPDLIFDGELYNHQLRDNFNQIISLVKKQKPTQLDLIQAEETVEYHVYDIYDGKDKSKDFFTRYLNVIKLVRPEDTENKVIPVLTHLCGDQDALDQHYATCLEQGYEGQMLRINGPYEQKRSKYLLKRKEFQDEEFEVVSISEGLGNWAGYAKSVRCRKSDGTEFDSGIRGTQAFTKELLGRTPKWVTVRYQNLTPDGIPRFPVAVAFFDEKRDV